MDKWTYNQPNSAGYSQSGPSVILLSVFDCTLILCSLHWPKVTECIKHMLLSITYKVLTTTQHPNLHSLISVVQRPRSTRSSSLVTLARPPASSSLCIADHSIRQGRLRHINDVANAPWKNRGELLQELRGGEVRKLFMHSPPKFLQ